jgi:hypothetical protein
MRHKLTAAQPWAFLCVPMHEAGVDPYSRTLRMLHGAAAKLAILQLEIEHRAAIIECCNFPGFGG